MTREPLVRLAFAATLAFLLAAPALAAGTSTLHVGVVVIGDLASSLAGNWVSSTAARGAIYHFSVSDRSGAVHKLVSLPLREPSAGRCDLRVSGVIYSLEPTAGSGYEMRYAIQAADVVTSSTDFDACQDVADSYLSDIPAADSLILSRAGEGRLIDSATGVAYSRTR